MSNLLCLVHLILNMKKIRLRYNKLLVIFSCKIFHFYCTAYSILYNFQGAAAVPKKTVRAVESTSSVSAGGLDGLPREDISGKITPTLLKSLESPDWKVWLLTCIKPACYVVSLCLLWEDETVFS